MDQDHDDQGGTAAAQDMPEDGDFIAEEDVVAEFEVSRPSDPLRCSSMSWVKSCSYSSLSGRCILGAV